MDLAALVLAFATAKSEAVDRRYRALSPPQPNYTIEVVNTYIPQLPGAQSAPRADGALVVVKLRF